MSKKGLLSLCAVLLALALAFPAVPALAEYNAYVKYTDSGRINLRSGPAAQYRVLAAIEPGTPLEVLDVVGKWAHIHVADPKGLSMLEGYMYTDYIDDMSGQIVHSYPMNTDIYSQNVYSSAYSSFAQITENTPMYVYTGNTGRLHLREYASQNARSLGLFPNGTSVTVLNRSGNWAYVSVNGVYGYMMLTYLSGTYVPQPLQPSYGAVIKYVNTRNSGRLHLREYASQNARSLGLFPNGTRVSATDLGNGWSYVTIGSSVGYMMTTFLSETEPYVPGPYPPGQYTVMYVYSATGSKAALRSAMNEYASSLLGSYGNGTLVYVLRNFGTWAYVNVNGIEGYMLTSALANAPYTPPVHGGPIGTATVRHPNGSFVYLRSTRSTDSLDNVLAKVPSGAKVTVYEKDEWYSLIEYNGILGYMVSHFLDWGTSPAPQPSGSTVKKMIVGGTALRSSRDESSAGNILAQLPHGAIIEILLTYPDEWRYVDFNGLKGYIHGPVVASVTSGDPSPLIPVVPESPVIFIGVVRHPNGSFVNLRYSRSSEDNTNVLAQVPSGTRVEVMEQTASNWSKVRCNGMVGYMVSSYIVPKNDSSSATVTGSVPAVPLMPAQPTGASSVENPASVPSVPLMPSQPTSGSVSGGKRVVQNMNSGFVYLRSSKDSSGTDNVLMKVYNGTTVDLLRDEGLWSFISVGGTTGYMVSSYLAFESQSFSSTNTGSGSATQISPAQPTVASSDETPASVSSVPLTPAKPRGVSLAQNQRIVRNKTSNFVYLRSSMDGNISSNIIMSVPNGTVVELLSMEGKWAKVLVNGVEGYMIANYLKTE